MRPMVMKCQYHRLCDDDDGMFDIRGMTISDESDTKQYRLPTQVISHSAEYTTELEATYEVGRFIPQTVARPVSRPRCQ